MLSTGSKQSTRKIPKILDLPTGVWYFVIWHEGMGGSFSSLLHTAVKKLHKLL